MMSDGKHFSKEGTNSKCTHVCLRLPCLDAASRGMYSLVCCVFLMASYNMVTYGNWTYISLTGPHIGTVCTLKQRVTRTVWSHAADTHKHPSTPCVSSSAPAVDSPDSVSGSATGSQRGTAYSQEIAKPALHDDFTSRS